jgi:hypothetical protein
MIKISPCGITSRNVCSNELISFLIQTSLLIITSLILKCNEEKFWAVHLLHVLFDHPSSMWKWWRRFKGFVALASAEIIYISLSGVIRFFSAFELQPKWCLVIQLNLHLNGVRWRYDATKIVICHTSISKKIIMSPMCMKQLSMRRLKKSKNLDKPYWTLT